MTGDDHGERRHRRPLRRLHRRQPARLLGGRLGVRPRHARTSIPGRRSSTTPRRSRTTGARLRDRRPREHRLRRLDAGVAATPSSPPSSPRSRSQLPEHAARRSTQPHPLHRLERLGDAAARSSSTHGIRLDTNYYYWPPAWVQDRPGPVHRLGHADALRRPRRHADRRLPGGDADDRRIGPDVPRSPSTRCSTAPSARRATTASSPPTCTPTARPSDGADAIVASAQARGVPIVSARQMLDWLDGRNGSAFGSIAWSVDTLALHRRRSRPAPTACRRCCRPHSARGVLGSITRDGGHRRRSRRRRSRASSTRSSPPAPGQYVGALRGARRHRRRRLAPPADCNDPTPRSSRAPRSPATVSTTTATARPTIPSPTSARRASVGVGACAAAGVRVCTGEGTGTVCNAIPSTPTPETCDGLDNDCDGAGRRDVHRPRRRLHGRRRQHAPRTGVQVCTRQRIGHHVQRHPGQRRRPRSATASTTTATARSTRAIPAAAAAARPDSSACARPGPGSARAARWRASATSDAAAETLQRPRRRLRRQRRRAVPAISARTCTVGVGDCARTGVKVCSATGRARPAARAAGAPPPRSATGATTTATDRSTRAIPAAASACSTGQPGVCAAGTTPVQGGALACVRNVAPTTETCNGVDDDCDGAIDEGTGGGALHDRARRRVRSGHARSARAASLLCVANARGARGVRRPGQRLRRHRRRRRPGRRRCVHHRGKPAPAPRAPVTARAVRSPACATSPRRSSCAPPARRGLRRRDRRAGLRRLPAGEHVTADHADAEDVGEAVDGCRRRDSVQTKGSFVVPAGLTSWRRTTQPWSCD